MEPQLPPNTTHFVTPRCSRSFSKSETRSHVVLSCMKRKWLSLSVALSRSLALSLSLSLSPPSPSPSLSPPRQDRSSKADYPVIIFKQACKGFAKLSSTIITFSSDDGLDFPAPLWSNTMILYASGSKYLLTLGPHPLPGPPCLHTQPTHNNYIGLLLVRFIGGG